MTIGVPLSRETRDLLDNVACGVLRTDGSGLILWANRTFCNWVGRNEAELAGRRRLQDLLTMGGRIFHQTHWSPLLQMQGSVSEVKIEIVHKDGEPVPMVMNALRREHDGIVVHEIALYVARDRDKYERELVQSRKKLEAVLAEATRLQEEAKDRASFAEQMVGIVSHDLRNPLSTIHMGAALLKKSELAMNQLAVVARLTRAAERANRLIGDLLDFTQARLGKGLAVTRKPIDLHKTVAETLDELALAFPSRRLVHERSGEGFFAADPDRLAQLLGNLVANAMTYGLPETPVTVTSSVVDHSAMLAVHNEGPEIPAATRSELFKPMARGDVEGSPARSVGLGLFIVSEIAKSHGGRVSLESGPGGTTFTVTLPRN